MSPNKKTKKNLTVNNLPTELVDSLKFLTIEFDCTITELMQVILEHGIAAKSTLYADIYKLRQAKARDREAMRRAQEELQQLRDLI